MAPAACWCGGLLGNLDPAARAKQPGAKAGHEADVECSNLALFRTLEVHAADGRDAVTDRKGVAAQGQVAGGGEQAAELGYERAARRAASHGEVAHLGVVRARVVGRHVREETVCLVDGAQRALGRRRVRLRAERKDSARSIFALHAPRTAHVTCTTSVLYLWHAQRNEGGVGSALLGRQLAEVGTRGPASDRVSDQLDRLLDTVLGLHLALHLGGGGVKRLEVKVERHLWAHLAPPTLVGERGGDELH
eukprot:scaffold30812_cov75-Phaeocystis_antarctica.AAC.2